ncbi:hypothetical protein [Nonomuraea sp. NPDC049400]|uniref:hypothetical protein n=1 Tax=Nonomuraea sp. NPDC049400 TaxID=3364352 RepID=UPI0037B4110E
MPAAPSHAEIEAQFTGILNGTITRDQADRWAAQWVTADNPDVDDELVWQALTYLFGIDLRDGPDEQYLHDDEDIAERLAEFRSHNNTHASGGGLRLQDDRQAQG